MTAPTQPRQPITMMMAPTAMSRLAADSEGSDDDRVAKFPWVTESHTPTPRMPHPPSCRGEREAQGHLETSGRRRQGLDDEGSRIRKEKAKRKTKQN